MIWDLKTIGNVSRLYADAQMSEEFVGGPQRRDAIESLRLLAANALIEMGHPLGVEIHPGDVRLVQLEQDREHRTRGLVPFRGGWKPETREVELAHAGEHDGRIYSVRRVGDPLRAHVAPSLSAYVAYDPPDPAASISIPIIEFALSGWNETARRWVYRPA